MIVAASVPLLLLLSASSADPGAVTAVSVKAVKEEGAKELQPRAVRASSFLKNGWNAAEENYLPLYVGDDNAKTAWVEGAAGDGIGEWLEWVGPRLETPRKYVVFVKNGYQKTPALFKANGRATKVKVELLVDGKATGAAVDVKLVDAMGWQRFEVPAGNPASSLRFTLGEVIAGKTYTDTCVSDVRVFVDAGDRYSAAAESLAQEEVRRFAAERARAAKQLKGRPSAQLPRLARAESSSSLIASAPTLPKAEALPEATTWRRVGAEPPAGARATADMEGFGTWAVLYPFLRREAVTYFDAPDRFAAMEKNIGVVQAREEREKQKFVAACVKERKAEKRPLDEYDCDCESEFYGCGSDGEGEAALARKDLETARMSGVFIAPGEPLLAPSRVLVVDARYLGDREPHLMTAKCLIDYTSGVRATCEETSYDGTPRAETYVLRVDDKRQIAALYGGEPGTKAESVWTPVIEVAHSDVKQP